MKNEEAPFRDVLPVTIELGEKFFTLFKGLKKQLWGSDQVAFEKLRDVIDEIMKFYLAMNKELSNFISMDFSNAKNKQENEKAFLEILGGSLKVRITDAQGHCKRIKRIYEEHLDKWLRKKLKDKEYFEIRNLFNSLSVYDDDMFEAASNLEKDLKEKSKLIIDFLGKKEIKNVLQAQVNNRKQYLPDLIKLGNVMSHLVELRNNFMEMSKTS